METKPGARSQGHMTYVRPYLTYPPRTGASRVFIFDHKTRHGPTNWHSLGPGNQAKRGPILRAHVDQSYAGAESLLRWLLPDEADKLLEKRWQIINVSIFQNLTHAVWIWLASYRWSDNSTLISEGLASHQDRLQGPSRGGGRQDNCRRGSRAGAHHLR